MYDGSTSLAVHNLTTISAANDSESGIAEGSRMWQLWRNTLHTPRNFGVEAHMLATRWHTSGLALRGSVNALVINEALDGFLLLVTAAPGFFRLALEELRDINLRRLAEAAGTRNPSLRLRSDGVPGDAPGRNRSVGA